MLFMFPVWTAAVRKLYVIFEIILYWLFYDLKHVLGEMSGAGGGRNYFEEGFTREVRGQLTLTIGLFRWFMC